MLNIEEINNTIEQLENGSTTFDSCQKLASLYIVRNCYLDSLSKVVSDKNTNDLDVIKEYSDILPEYSRYCSIKRKYQLNELGKDVVLESLKCVCKEINEFIHTLYNSTDFSEERDIIISNFKENV